MKAALAIVKEKFGRLDIAVNCAGIGIAVVTLNPNKDRVHDLDEFMRVLNVRVLLAGCLAVLVFPIFLPSPSFPGFSENVLVFLFFSQNVLVFLFFLKMS